MKSSKFPAPTRPPTPDPAPDVPPDLTVRHRATWVTAAVLTVLLLALALLSLLLGSGATTMGEAWDFLAGRSAARADPQVRLAVLEVRLPRTLAAVLVGACLGA